MEVESLWRSRLRWRWRGALLWPLFGALTILDAALLTVLPISGDGGTPFIEGLLLGTFFNLVAVAVGGPLLAWALRRRRRDLPKVVAEDYTGAAMVVLVTALLLTGGLLHAPVRAEAERDYAAQLHAAGAYVSERAPAEYRDGVAAMTTVKVEDELYRTCAPGDDPERWFCVFVSTDRSPPLIRVDRSRESNELFSPPGGFAF